MEPENTLTAPAGSGAGIKAAAGQPAWHRHLFVPFELGGRSTIVVDHLAGFLVPSALCPDPHSSCSSPYGAITPPCWMKARPSHRQVLSLFKLLGLALAILYVTDWGPAWLMTPIASLPVR